MRIGQGFDVHKFEAGRKLIIGGVEIPHDRGLAGHSDADVLTHALMDALLGALALGDIGAHFPDTDAVYQDADSIDLFKQTIRLIRRYGWDLVNADTTLIAEEPKFAPHIGKIQRTLAEAIDVNASQISVKATTTEKLGFTGRGEGIAANAIVLIKRI